MTRRGMMIIVTIGAFGLVAMLIMMQQVLEETQQVGPLLKLRRDLEQIVDVKDVEVRRNTVSSVSPGAGDQPDKRHWIVVRVRPVASVRDDETFARSIIEEAERTYEGDRQAIHGYRVECLSPDDPERMTLVLKKTRGPAPTTVTRPHAGQ